jgi:hypothetical protein
MTFLVMSEWMSPGVHAAADGEREHAAISRFDHGVRAMRGTSLHFSTARRVERALGLDVRTCVRVSRAAARAACA